MVKSKVLIFLAGVLLFGCYSSVHNLVVNAAYHNPVVIFLNSVAIILNILLIWAIITGRRAAFILFFASLAFGSISYPLLRQYLPPIRLSIGGVLLLIIVLGGIEGAVMWWKRVHLVRPLRVGPA
jgi:hypothetical protein